MLYTIKGHIDRRSIYAHDTKISCQIIVVKLIIICMNTYSNSILTQISMHMIFE